MEWDKIITLQGEIIKKAKHSDITFLPSDFRLEHSTVYLF